MTKVFVKHSLLCPGLLISDKAVSRVALDTPGLLNMTLTGIYIFFYQGRPDV